MTECVYILHIVLATAPIWFALAYVGWEVWMLYRDGRK